MTKHISRFKEKILVCLLLLTFVKVYAQKNEIGGMIGPSYCWSDVANNFETKNIRLGASLFFRHHLNPLFSLRASLSYARVMGADSLSEGSTWQTNRNLSFWTDIFEVSGIVEYNLVPDDNIGRKVKKRGIPYVFAGIGFFHFNPKSNNPITGEVNELQPLKLNGVSYSLNALCIPLGFGYRYYLNRRWQIGVEFGMRYSLSSYIDDVKGTSIYPTMEEMESDDARIMYNPSLIRLENIRNHGTTYIGGSDGKPRGKNGNISDVYFITGVTVSYRLWPGEAARCPRVY